LFSLGVFLVIITVIRLPLNIKDSSFQVNRTTWASVESFTAAFVANVPTLYTLRKKLPEKVIDTEISTSWTETVGSSMSKFPSDRGPQAFYKHKITAEVPTKQFTTREERRKAIMMPPPVPPKDELPGRRAIIKTESLENNREESTGSRSSAILLPQDERRWPAPMDRHAHIKNGRMEYMSEERQTEMIDWDEVGSVKLDIIMARYYEDL
jgi:hypothetical protein